jgi:uncharacterized phage protein (TIGR01671 family)
MGVGTKTMNKREIKFRAWDSKNDVMRDWDYIRTSWTLSILNGDSNTELMQFTGLKDKNLKEIYEGDLVAVLDGEEQTGTYEVEYCGDRNYPAFDFKGWDGETNGLSEAKEVFEIEVIGNIYENPELLK